jgi:PPOX class probable F420-dependent enzyme
MSLGDEKYVLFTTYRRNGTPVATPVWIVGLDDGTFGFTTSSASGKAKRLRNDNHVLVQPSDARGHISPGSVATHATATVVTGPEGEAIRTKVRAKYGIMTSVTKVLGFVGGIVKGKRVPYGDCGVVITLTP